MECVDDEKDNVPSCIVTTVTDLPEHNSELKIST